MPENWNFVHFFLNHVKTIEMLFQRGTDEFMQVKTALLLFGLLLAAFYFAGESLEQPQTDSATKRYEAQFLTLFDTVTTIVGYGEDKEQFTKQAQFFHDRLEEYHQLYDIYEAYEGMNNLKTVNDQAGIAPVKVDGRIIDLLKFAKEMNSCTGGAVNIAMGSVLSVWHDYRSRGIDDPAGARLPPMEELREAAAHIEIEQLVIDEAASTVYLEDPEMRLDVGAVAKGYAVEQVCRQAEAAGFRSLLVSVGGNVRAIGAKDAAGTPWEVGIQNPWQERDGEKLLGTVGLEDSSLVTSGVYQRYYTVAGKRYHHIIQPDTLMPSERFEAVTILCADSGEADALSTALFNMDYESGAALIETFSEVEAALPKVKAALLKVEALWIFPDGTTKQSAGFQMWDKTVA